jgi:hypothetical protein
MAISGFGFHNASMSLNDRKVIEDLFIKECSILFKQLKHFALHPHLHRVSTYPPGLSSSNRHHATEGQE